MERWADVPGFEGLYSVSSDGRVKRHLSRVRNGQGWIEKPERIVPPTVGVRGYAVVNLWRDNRVKQMQVHRLVMLAFCGPSELSVDHINGDCTDNRLENLRYCTLAENTRFQHEAGRVRFVRGEENGMSKLNADKVRLARRLRAEGQTRPMVARRLGVSPGAIQAIEDGRTWSHVS